MTTRAGTKSKTVDLDAPYLAFTGPHMHPFNHQPPFIFFYLKFKLLGNITLDFRVGR